MASPYDQLIQAITETGVSEDEARHAARRCAMAMAKQGLAGYAGASVMTYFLAMNPATALPYLIATPALGAAYALAKSPQCADVREAIGFWNMAPI